MSNLNVARLIRKSRDLDAGLKADYEQARIGTLRAGSSGMISEETGEIAGTCHRRAHLRSLGVVVEEPTNDSKSIIFARGRDQEFSLLQDIESALPIGYVLLREEEIPTEWSTINNTRVTGRPDGVICEVQDRGLRKYPVIGIEVKSVGSVWVSKSVLLELQPKLVHFQQAAHYMWQLRRINPDLTYKLIYRQNSQLILPNYPFIQKLIPSDNSDFRYGLIKWDKAGRPLELLPYTIVYDLQLDGEGRLYYKLEHEKETKLRPTIVTIPQLIAYYEYVSTFGVESDDLGPRPSAIGALGEKLNFKDCDYCPLKSVCTKYEKSGYSIWLEQVKAVLTPTGERESK